MSLCGDMKMAPSTISTLNPSGADSSHWNISSRVRSSLFSAISILRSSKAVIVALLPGCRSNECSRAVQRYSQ
jgi:hypothetical protein